jgi:hypothetical protein
MARATFERCVTLLTELRLAKRAYRHSADETSLQNALYARNLAQHELDAVERAIHEWMTRRKGWPDLDELLEVVRELERVRDTRRLLNSPETVSAERLRHKNEAILMMPGDLESQARHELGADFPAFLEAYTDMWLAYRPAQVARPLGEPYQSPIDQLGRDRRRVMDELGDWARRTYGLPARKLPDWPRSGGRPSVADMLTAIARTEPATPVAPVEIPVSTSPDPQPVQEGTI